MGRLSYGTYMLTRRMQADNAMRQANENITAYDQKLKDTANAGIFERAKSSVKSYFGMGDVLPDLPDAPKEYQNLRNSQLNDQYRNTPGGRLNEWKLGVGQEKLKEGVKKYGEGALRMALPALTPEQVKKKGELMVGAGKNLGELASGTAKLAAEFSPLTGMSGIRKLTKFIGGKKVSEYIDSNTPEYLKKVDAFVDNNGILNYKPDYKTEAEKTGGEITEIGSWFIPITRWGKAAKIEQAVAEIPRVANLLKSTPKIVKSGGKLFYEVGKDAIDIGILDTIRGKDWETIKTDMEMGAAGGTALRVAGKVFKGVGKLAGKLAGEVPEEKFAIEAEKVAEETVVPKETVVEKAPEAPKTTPETIKPETGVKTPEGVKFRKIIESTDSIINRKNSLQISDKYTDEQIKNAIKQATPEFIEFPNGKKIPAVDLIEINKLLEESEQVVKSNPPLQEGGKIETEITNRIEKFRKEAGLMATNERAGVRSRDVVDANGNFQFQSNDFSLRRAKSDMFKRASDSKKYAESLLYENDPEFKKLIDKRDELLVNKIDNATDELDVEKIFNDLNNEEKSLINNIKTYEKQPIEVKTNQTTQAKGTQKTSRTPKEKTIDEIKGKYSLWNNLTPVKDKNVDVVTVMWEDNPYSIVKKGINSFDEAVSTTGENIRAYKFKDNIIASYHTKNELIAALNKLPDSQPQGITPLQEGGKNPLIEEAKKYPKADDFGVANHIASSTIGQGMTKDIFIKRVEQGAIDMGRIPEKDAGKFYDTWKSILDDVKANKKNLGYEEVWKESQRITPKVETPKSPGVAKAAHDINVSLAKKGMDSLPEEELARYTPTTKAEVEKKIATVMDDWENAKKIVMGKGVLPHGIPEPAFFESMANKADELGDVKFQLEMAKSSPMASSSSLAGQELGSTGWFKKNQSVVSIIKDVIKRRSENIKGKFGETKQATKKVVEEIKKTVKSVPHSKQTWADFVEEIKCK